MPDLVRKDKMTDWLSKNKLTFRSSLYEIIFNISDICTRKCRFCPRGLGYTTPHINPFMDIAIVEKVCQDLGNAYTGLFSLSGFGEPTLHPAFKSIVEVLQKRCPNARIMIITNGDNIDSLKDLHNVYIEISMYEPFSQSLQSVIQSLDAEVKIKDIEHSSIRLFNNRGGNANVGMFDKPLIRCCNIPFFKMDIDVNGDVILCCSDWKRESVMGNVMESNIYGIWNNEKYRQVRNNLINNDRKSCVLCRKCNADGLLNGQEFVEFWKNNVR